MGRSNLSLNLFKSDQYINWLKNTESKSTIPPEVTCTSEGDKTLRFTNKACMVHERNLASNFTSVKKVGTIKSYRVLFANCFSWNGIFFSHLQLWECSLKSHRWLGLVVHHKCSTCQYFFFLKENFYEITWNQASKIRCKHAEKFTITRQLQVAPSPRLVQVLYM